MREPVGAQVQFDIRVALRDGIKLSAILYAPKNCQQAAPALLAMTPYVAQRHHETAMHFAENGYPFLAVDVRGRGNSEGVFHPLNEARDAYDVIEWLARQPYCNGRVAMWGGSYLAYCQWAAAGMLPPHLMTIVPVASPFHGVDVPLRGNVFTPYTMRWLTIVSGHALQDTIFADQSFWNRKFCEWFEAGVPFNRLDTLAGNPSAMFQEWVAHPHRDSYWDSYEPTAQQCSQISIPILTITGAYDGDQLGALEHYRRFMKTASADACALHYLILGPWDHTGTGAPKAEFGGLKLGPASVVDMRKLHLEWYRWTLQGGSRPSFLRNKVAYYVTGVERWRYADTLEAITVRSEPLYLRSLANPTDVFMSGSLASEAPATSDSDHYVYDPADVSHAKLESQLDPASFVDQCRVYALTGKQLVYHSAPLAADTDVAGFFRLCLWLSIDQPDTDICATVQDVALDGSVVHLASDWKRARHRESEREARPIQVTLPLRYDFERFMFVARRMRKGHRLRLVLGPINSIHWQKNYNSGRLVAEESMADARPVAVRVFHDNNHPSALYVPHGAQGSVEEMES